MPVKKIIRIQKSNNFNQADFTNLGLSCYRVMLHLISKIQRTNEYGVPIPISDINRSFSLSARDYAEQFELQKHTAYEILQFAARKLIRSPYQIKIENKIVEIAICSQAEYIKDQGQINIEFNPNIMPHLSELTNEFTMYHLNDISRFNSIYTTRLYELIMQYKTTGILKISISDLRFSLGCTKVFKRYNDFKRKTFEHAINEINSQFDINIKYEEFKNKRTFESIIFMFKKITLSQTYDVAKEKYRTQVSRYKRMTN